MASIDDLKAKLSGGGARPNLFRVTLNFPAYAGGDSELASFLTKSATIPPSVLGVIEVPFRGRKLKIPGDRTFETWNITVINDLGYKLRNAFMAWSNGINANADNTGTSVPNDYMTDLLVEQLDSNENVVKSYKIVGSWPSNIGEIELNNETNDTIEEFTVEFQYQYWV